MKCQRCGKEIPEGYLRCSFCGCIQSTKPGFYTPPSKKQVFFAKLGKGGIVAILLILVSLFFFAKTQTPEAILFGKWEQEEVSRDPWSNGHTDSYVYEFEFTIFSNIKATVEKNGKKQDTEPQKVTYRVNNGKLITSDGDTIQKNEFDILGDVLEIDGDSLTRSGGLTKTSLLVLSIVLFFGSVIYLYKRFKD